VRGLLDRYRILHFLGVGRIVSMRATWRVEHGRLPDGENWPEP
jgi:hypothetical protein